MDLTNVADWLTVEFEGIFSPETVSEIPHDSALRWGHAPVQTHVAVLSERFTREDFAPSRRLEGRS